MSDSYKKTAVANVNLMSLTTPPSQGIKGSSKQTKSKSKWINPKLGEGPPGNSSRKGKNRFPIQTPIATATTSNDRKTLSSRVSASRPIESKKEKPSKYSP